MSSSIAGDIDQYHLVDGIIDHADHIPRGEDPAIGDLHAYLGVAEVGLLCIVETGVTRNRVPDHVAENERGDLEIDVVSRHPLRKVRGAFPEAAQEAGAEVTTETRAPVKLRYVHNYFKYDYFVDTSGATIPETAAAAHIVDVSVSGKCRGLNSAR